jgi:protein O-GlcNAc transferase
MPQSKTLDIATEHHQAGRLDDARKLYEQILSLPLHPDEADALHLLGVLSSQQGDIAKARDLILRAIALRPTADLFHINLGTICGAAGIHQDAVTHFQQAVKLNPNVRPSVFTAMAQSLAALGRMNESVDAFEWAIRRERTAEGLVASGEALMRAGRPKEAHDRINEALLLRPNFAEAHGARGLVYEKQGELDDAEHCYRAAIALGPELAHGHNNLGHIYILKKRWHEAIAELRRAVELEENLFQAHFNLGDALAAQGDHEKAIESYRRVTELRPDFADAWEKLASLLMERRQFAPAADAYRALVQLCPTDQHYANLGAALGAIDEMDDAIAALQKAVELNPYNAYAHQALGAALQWCGQLDEAMTSLRRAMQLSPNNDAAHSRLLYTMLFHGGFCAKEVFDEHIAWGKRHTGHLIQLPPPQVDRAPDRRLRIGYVSPNFRNQAIMSFVLPIIEHRDPWETEVYCYSDTRISDQWTRKLQDAADEWRYTSNLTHAQLAQVIRQDKIDILVDLTGHIGDGRLQAFAYKPAPIQAMYIGYQATTGLPAIDYFLSDEWANPPGQSDQYFTEKVLRLPGPFFCYAPPPEAPDVGELPMRSNGHVTFGCFNNLAKVTPRTIALWSRVMNAVPNSKMILLTPHGRAIQQRLINALESGGVSADRIEFVRRVAPAEYLQRYNRVDIALDPVPFNGHTTTCDAAWMGCPTIMLAGEMYAQRYGGSVLRNIGLTDLVTDDDDDYIRTAAQLARDVERLSHIRATLRSTMQQSPITDGPGFTHGLEKIYRQIWRDWCNRD